MPKLVLTRILLVWGLFFTLGAQGQASNEAGQAPLPENKTQQFLSLADLHFDPFLSCSESPCLLIQKLEAAPVPQWRAIFARYDHSTAAFGHDSNEALLASALAAAKKEAQASQVQFVLVLGDFLAHNYNKKYFNYSADKTEAGYIAFVKKTMEFFAQELKLAFPQTDIYWLVGNNDSYEEDYSLKPGGRFFKDLGELQASLVKNNQAKQAILRDFPQGGYYAVNAPGQPRLRLVFLNSVLFSTKAKGSQVEQAAEAQLDWLHQELTAAKVHRQRVLIAMHIPSGIDVYTTLFVPFSIIEFWKPAYSQRFLSEIQQASGQIMGVFPAHLHADTFQIFTDAKHHALPFTGTPSISPVFGNNPAFKVYSYSIPALRLVDFVTYYYSLNNKNEWQKEYDFDEVYQLNHSDGEITTGMFQLQPRGELADHYKTYYAVSSNSQPITKYNKWLPYYWCAIRGLTPREYQSCLYSSSSSR